VEAGDDPDVRLMLAAQAGDAEAFQQLYAKYARQIVRFATQFCGSQARAEELAQDVFLQVYRARHTYEARARFSTWLFRIATNACLSEMRRPEHRTVSTSLDAPDGDDEDAPSRDLPDPESPEGEASTLASEKRERLRRLLERLPPQQRAAVLLARAEGFSYDEVAESIGVTVPAVKSLIHRATLALRDGMKRYEAGE
jgi:RNA polymerase sigma-70 factor, ECF subfamily